MVDSSFRVRETNESCSIPSLSRFLIKGKGKHVCKVSWWDREGDLWERVNIKHSRTWSNKRHSNHGKKKKLNDSKQVSRQCITCGWHITRMKFRDFYSVIFQYVPVTGLPFTLLSYLLHIVSILKCFRIISTRDLVFPPSILSPDGRNRLVGRKNKSLQKYPKQDYSIERVQNSVFPFSIPTTLWKWENSMYMKIIRFI